VLGVSLLLQGCGSGAAPAGSGSGAAAASAGASAGASASQQAIKIAYIAATITHEPLHLAKTRGFFAKQGLDVTLQDAAAAAQVAALGAGEVQFATVASSSLVSAVAGGSPVAMMASLADVPTVSMYSTKDVKSPRELAGKSVGVGRVGAATDLAAQLFLKHENLTNSVKIVAVGGESPAVLAALSKGLVAAGVFSPPATSQAASMGYVELINGPKLGLYWNNAGVVATRAYLKDHADTAKRVAQALTEAWAYLGSPANKDQVVADIAQATSASPADAAISYDYMLPVWQSKKSPFVDPRGLVTAIDLAREAQGKGLKPEDMMDGSFVPNG
jgi:ABC-type nitrate/sulfonate/bicarbonate transport system substrate-binding protein